MLTAADGEATGSSAWSPWKAGLVNELADRTAAVLAGRPVPPGPPFPSEEHRHMMAAGGLEVLPSERELVVIAPDRPGLFSAVAGALALHNIGVLQARAHSENGMALEVFALDLLEHADPRWERVVADIKAGIEQRINVGEMLARRPPPRRARRVLPLPSPGVVVLVDNEAATSATVVEVRAPDGPGLLHLVTAAISAARASTSSRPGWPRSATRRSTPSMFRPAGPRYRQGDQTDTLRHSHRGHARRRARQRCHS